MRAEPWEHHEQAGLELVVPVTGGALKTSRPEAERGSGPENGSVLLHVVRGRGGREGA